MATDFGSAPTILVGVRMGGAPSLGVSVNACQPCGVNRTVASLTSPPPTKFMPVNPVRALDAALNLGLYATSHPSGAGKTKTRPILWYRRPFVVVPSTDAYTRTVHPRTSMSGERRNGVMSREVGMNPAHPVSNRSVGRM